MLSIKNTEYKVPFNRACVTGDELKHISKVISNGNLSGDGFYTKECSKLIQSITNSQKVLLTTSCTSALDMSAILLKIQDGDEVIIPSYTFVSTANSFATHGAKIVFADIREDTLNLDENKLEELITDRTRAIVPVHYAGVGCEMDAIISLSKKNNLTIIEDNAHGFMGSYKGRALGSFGHLSTLSFHETKNFTCGEGGALVINDNDLIDRAEIIREKGTDRSKFFRGQIDKYSWTDFGSSFLPSEILSAHLFVQLEKREIIQQKRRSIWEKYYKELLNWSSKNGVRLPYIPEHCEQAYHMFYIVLPDEETRKKLIVYLKTKKILSVFHYLPLHKSAFAKSLGLDSADCPISENVSSRLLRLPFYFNMSEEQQNYVITSILNY